MVRHNFKKSQTRKEDHHLKALQKAQRIIDLKFEQNQAERNAAAEDDKKATEMNVRPPTPKYPWSNLGISAQELAQEDKAQRAILLLQRLLRGRAEQNRMFEGKEKRLDLITELRLTEEWRESSDLPEERDLIHNY